MAFFILGMKKEPMGSKIYNKANLKNLIISRLTVSYKKLTTQLS